MNPIILYRDVDIAQEELKAMATHFPLITTSRMAIREGELVIPRYSCLPFYEEQEFDMILAGAKLINTYEDFSFIADIGAWSQYLEGLTPRTWALTGEFSKGTNALPEHTSFVLKGATNSMKRLWSTHMFAKDKSAVPIVLNRLMDDSLISQQTIYAREYVPLKQVSEGLNGLPITLEFRFFVVYGQLISGAFYWSSHVSDLKDIPNPEQVPRDFIDKVIKKISSVCHNNFYTIDVAITESGEPIVIELNSGEMSGLSENNPDTLYRRLREVIDDKQRTDS